MTSNNFSHLHSHTSVGSMCDSLANIYELFNKASQIGQPAIAITDHGSMAAMYDMQEAAKKYKIKAIPGLESYFVNDVEEKTAKRLHLILLAKNEIGYKNLLSLNYEGFLNKQYVPILNKVFPRIDWKLIKKYNKGIICLTACGSGPIAKTLLAYDEDYKRDEVLCTNRALGVLQRLRDIFEENLFIELQAHCHKAYALDRKTKEIIKNPNGQLVVVSDQVYLNKKLFGFAKLLDIPMVGTTDVHYIDKSDFKAHDMLIAINDKAPLNDKFRHRYDTDELYLKNRSEMEDYFSRLFGSRAAKQICDNTIEVSNLCEDSEYLDSNKVHFPEINLKSDKDYESFNKWKEKNKSNIKEENLFLRFKCQQSFKEKFDHLSPENKKLYWDRICEEIKVLEMHNFSSYMLIVSDYIQHAKSKNIRVGIGRGSVCGSLVANLLNIHGIDSIEYGLLFERFHNKEKKAFPDIDTDFSPNGRDDVENYIVEKYGNNRVAHVSNLSRMTPKVVIKDVARSLELGGSKSAAFQIANKITDTIPSTALTFDEAFKQSKEFRDYCAKYPDLEYYGRKLVGLEKVFATHAAGIVISDTDLSTLVPLRIDKDGAVSVQYEKNRCEKVGLIKMDLLGLDHLRIIEDTISNAKSINLECSAQIPLNDKKVWEEISKGHTMCVFQMESPHMSVLCKQIKPKNVEELAVVNALGRPSAAKSRDIYIARKDGRAKVNYDHPKLENSLKETLGICVYEEQLIKLAADVAGWDRNKADGLRKLTKAKEKGRELAAKLETEFCNDSIKNGVQEKDAKYIWTNVIEPFAGYGFNKAHAIPYSINGYESAYYKIYYPSAFMAAILKSEAVKNSQEKDYNIRTYKKEAARLGIEVLPPEINTSDIHFKAKDQKTITTGLIAIKGVGIAAIENILKMRKQHVFKSFADFLYRTDSKLVRKNVIEALAKAGCFDNLNINRKDASQLYIDIRKKANLFAKKCDETIKPEDKLNDFIYEYSTPDNEWTLKEKLEGEKEVLGEYISGSINDVYQGFFTNKNVIKLNNIKTIPDGVNVRIEAIISDIKSSKLKKGKNIGKSYARCSMSDLNGDTASLTIWPGEYIKYKDKLSIGIPIRAICKINNWNNTNTLILQSIEEIAK